MARDVSTPHNIPLGGGTGPERLGGDAARGEPKTLVGAPLAETPHPKLGWTLSDGDFEKLMDELARLRGIEEQISTYRSALERIDQYGDDYTPLHAIAREALGG